MTHKMRVIIRPKGTNIVMPILTIDGEIIPQVSNIVTSNNDQCFSEGDLKINNIDINMNQISNE